MSQWSAPGSRKVSCLSIPTLIEGSTLSKPTSTALRKGVPRAVSVEPNERVRPHDFRQAAELAQRYRMIAADPDRYRAVARPAILSETRQ